MLSNQKNQGGQGQDQGKGMGDTSKRGFASMSDKKQ